MSDLSWLNPTPHAIAVYASQPTSPLTTQHSLPSGRYSLLGPDFHRLDRTRFCPGPSLDHLVGEQLDRVGHLDAEPPSRLQVDDELEFGRPDDRQFGGLRALENSTRVDTDLTPRIQIIGPIAHQQARFDHLPAETTRRYPIVPRARRELDSPAIRDHTPR